jgi:hypothetical protein
MDEPPWVHQRRRRWRRWWYRHGLAQWWDRHGLDAIVGIVVGGLAVLVLLVMLIPRLLR